MCCCYCSRRVVAKHFPTGAAPPSVVPGSPRSARPRTQAARASDTLSVPGVVLDACRLLLADSKSQPAGSELESMPIFKDIDDLLSTPSPTLSQPVMHTCRHAHGPAPAASESCSEGPVVQLLDGVLACLEWRALRAGAPVLDIVAGMDSGRRKWNLAAVAVSVRVFPCDITNLVLPCCLNILFCTRTVCVLCFLLS